MWALLIGLQEAEFNAQASQLVWATANITYCAVWRQLMAEIHALQLQQELALMPAEQVYPNPMMISCAHVMAMHADISICMPGTPMQVWPPICK